MPLCRKFEKVSRSRENGRLGRAFSRKFLSIFRRFSRRNQFCNLNHDGETSGALPFFGIPFVCWSLWTGFSSFISWRVFRILGPKTVSHKTDKGSAGLDYQADALEHNSHKIPIDIRKVCIETWGTARWGSVSLQTNI